MTSKRKTGATGLSILDIDASSKSHNISKESIAKWCKDLPLADIGICAKQLFIRLTELSETPLSANERFSIMELIRGPNKEICTALKRHYIEQRTPLTENKLIIANLRQTLLGLMADNYKLILEELHNKSNLSNDEKKLLVTTIVRIYYYLNVLLICRYQLYSYTPSELWHEIYVLYKYAKERDLLNINVPCDFSPKGKTTIFEAFMHIVLLYATDPYQWRQSEQHSLNKAIEMWSFYPTIYVAKKIPKKNSGVYILDLDNDLPPTHIAFRTEELTENCIGIDLDKHVKHMKKILDKMQNDQLKAKIENPNDPEFSVTAPTVAKLINTWSQTMQRNEQRFPIQAEIKIVFGLNAAHYYLNDEQEFNPHPSNLQTDVEEEKKSTSKAFSNNLNLSLYEVSETEEDDEDEEDEKDVLSSTEAKEKEDAAKKQQDSEDELDEAEKADVDLSKELLYHIYNYNIENINQHGFCIVISDKSYPPFQAGEIVAFKNTTKNDENWGIGAVRWLRRQVNEDFYIGIQIIAATATAGGIQIMREDKPASRLSRCLLIDEDKANKIPPTVITSALPIKTKNVMLYCNDDEPFKATLTKEIDASGMYYQYYYASEDSMNADKSSMDDSPTKPEEKTVKEEDKTNTEFDKIWGDL